MDKRQLRREAQARRKTLCSGFSDEAGRAVLAHLLSMLPVGNGQVIAGYQAMQDELPLDGIFSHLEGQGFSTALPVVDRVEQAMHFVAWRTGEPLKKGAYGLQEPAVQEAVVVPDILLLPLLAFDVAGHRLGYGGGYYDRYLAGRRDAQGMPLCIGVGYAGQAMVQLPHELHDIPLDWVVTEEYARKF